MAAKKPRCIRCGKSLRKRTYGVEVLAGAPAPTECYGRKVVSVISRRTLSFRRKDSEAPPEDVSVWCGEWGSYGDNRFCGLRCGWRYAVQNSRPATGT